MRALSFSGSHAADYGTSGDAEASVGGGPKYNTEIATSEVSNNDVSNSGTIYATGKYGMSGISLHSGANSAGYASAEMDVSGSNSGYATAGVQDVTATSEISHNTITNTGDIAVIGNGDKYNITHVPGASVLLSLAHDGAFGGMGIGGKYQNGVGNLLGIMDSSTAGILVSSHANAYGSAMATVDGNPSYDASADASVQDITATSKVDGNTIYNSGSIYAHGLSGYFGPLGFMYATNTGGIKVNSIATATGNAHAYGDNASDTEGSAVSAYAGDIHATAIASNNTIINNADASNGGSKYSGSIATFGNNSSGISVFAAAYADAHAAVGSFDTAGSSVDGGGAYVNDLSGTATAEDNLVHNTGTIYTFGYNSHGIAVLATAQVGSHYLGQDGNSNEVYGYMASSGLHQDIYLGSIDVEGPPAPVNLYIGEYSTVVDASVASVDNITGTSTVDTNTVTNDGVIRTGDKDTVNFGHTNHSFGIAVVAYGQSYGTAYAAVNSTSDYGYARASVNNVSSYAYADHNRVTNNGAIYTGGSESGGILVGAYADAAAYARSYTLAGDVYSNPRAYASIGSDVEGFGVKAYANSEDNTVTNAGIIETYGDYSDGIAVVAGAHASGTSNAFSGDIEGYQYLYTGRAAVYGISASAYAHDNAVTNGGRITTYGDNSRGILVGAYARVSGVAYGDYSSSVENLYAHAETNYNEVSNSGLIDTRGAYSAGIAIVADVRMVVDTDGYVNNNSGSIAKVHDNVVENTGAIRTYGQGSDGVLITAYWQYDYQTVFYPTKGVYHNTVNNSGAIVAAYGNSININGDYNYINLAAPAFLGGMVEMGDYADVTITTGPSQSNVWHFRGYAPDFYVTGSGMEIQTTGIMPASPGFSIDGNVPYWYSYDPGTQITTIATFDPTTFAAAGNQLGNLAGMVSNFGLQGLNKAEKGVHVWVAAAGSTQEYKGNGTTTLDQKTDQSAIAMGIGANVTPDIVIGGLFGYGMNAMDADSAFSPSYRNKSDGLFLGLNGRATFGALALDLGVAGGWKSNKTKRFINDNLADDGYTDNGTADTGDATLGIAWATGKYDSWWVSPEAGLSMDFEMSKGFALTPFARARYAMQSSDGYTESTDYVHVGTGDPVETASVGGFDTNVFEANIGLALSKVVGNGAGKATLKGGYLFRDVSGDNTVDVTMLGYTQAISVDTADGSAPYVGAEFLYNLSQSMQLNLNGQATYVDGNVGGLASGTFIVNF